MGEWKKVRLGEVGYVVTGKTPSSKFPNYFGQGVPFVTPTDFKSYHKYIFHAIRGLSNEGLESLKNKLLPVESIIVTCIGSDMGKVAVNKTPCVTNQQINSIIPDVKKIDPNFLYYKLMHEYETLKLLAVGGSTMPILNKGDFEKIEIEIPDLPAQTRIASILSAFDDKIELNRQMNHTLEQMAQALFKKYFVDDVDREKLPEGWRMGKLGELIFVQNGYAFKSSDFKDEGSIGVIKIRNINDNIVDVDNTQYVNDKIVQTIDLRFKVNQGDILIAMTGAEVGKIGIVPSTQKSLWLNQRVGSFKEKTPFSSLYNYILLTSDQNQELLQSTAVGSAQPNISGSNIENIPCVIPPLEKISQFGLTVKPMFDLMITNLGESKTLKDIRDSLLPKLMYGEINVLQLPATA